MNKLAIVMYHYVRDLKHSRYPEIKGLDLELFEQQLKFFQKNYNVVSMEDVILSLESNVTLPENPVLLTFDDGYVDHFTNVYPLLRSMNFQGSFFIPAKTVLEYNVLDVNKIHFILASGVQTKEILTLLKSEIQHYTKEFSLKAFDVYWAEYAHECRYDSKEIVFIKRMLQVVLPEVLRNKITSKMFSQFIGIKEDVFARELYMSVAQCEQLVRDGMHVGCHGYEHYWWNKLPREMLEQEILLSKKFLSSIGCNMNFWTACYPYGSVCDDAIDILKNEGCRLAVTTEVRFANLDTDSAYTLPRLDTNDFPPKSENYLNVR